jgi:23S rRNA pseudouridine2605 synthase
MLILTNDGDFAHLVTHPKHELPKTYLAKIKGILDEKAIESLEMGVFLDDGKTAPAKIKKIRKEEANSWVEITIHEGRKRQVRRMFDRVGRSVIKLKRIRTGSLLLGDLPEGSFRYLTHEEVQGLKDLSQRTEVRSPEPVVRTRKAEIRPQRAAEIGRDERRPTSAREGRRESTDKRRETRLPKTVHKGKPDVRPWRAATRGEESRQETRDAGRRPGFGPRKASSSRPAFRTSTSSAVTRPAAGKSSMRAAPWKSDAGKKPGKGSWSSGKTGDSRSSGFGRGPQGEERRPSSGPRPNRSSRPTGKRPGQGSRPASRGRGPTAGGRGPRR